MRVVRRPGGEVRTAPRHAKNTNCRECFHAATVTVGGERSWISAAVSRSTTFIGPLHLGQCQGSEESLVEETFVWLSVVVRSREGESKAVGEWHAAGWLESRSCGCA